MDVLLVVAAWAVASVVVGLVVCAVVSRADRDDRSPAQVELPAAVALSFAPAAHTAPGVPVEPLGR